MLYRAYNLLLALAAVLLVPYYLVRSRLKGQPWSSLPQRFGALPASFDSTGSDSIWLHAVSVGEVLSCQELIKALRKGFPRSPIFVSTTTVTGQRLAQEKLAPLVNGIFYAPLDFSFAVRRVLATLRPRLVIIAETEIWPNLFRQVKRFGASLLLVNGRISDRALPRYRLTRFFFSGVLAHADVILAQSDFDRKRLIQIGAPENRTQAGGNLKYDFEPSDTRLQKALRDFLSRLKPETVIVAGSTREGEEEPVIKAFRAAVERRQRSLLVLAPRHPERFVEVAGILSRTGLPCVLRSQLSAAEKKNFSLPGVLLLDTLGELASLYPLADVVFVGGSLNGWGGHNVLEPALAGKPVVVGPTMQNFRAITDELLRQQAIVQVESAEHLPAALVDLLTDRERAAVIGTRGRKVAEAQRGAAETAVREAKRLYGLAMPRVPPRLLDYIVLGLPTVVWAVAARLRMWAYEQGLFRRRKLRAFTLCVGNLSAGGVGKTPMVLWLVEQLQARGYRTGVLLRGYRRVSPERRTVTHPRSEVSPLRSGDEGQILLRHFRKLGLAVPIGIGSDRYSVGSRMEQEQPLDVVVLDDGFQHFQLERQFDLVLVDAMHPLGGGLLLPLGRLREPESGIRRAAAIVFTRTERGRGYEGLEERLRRHNHDAPIFRSDTQMLGAVEAATGREVPLETVRLRRALAVCGVGNPAFFWCCLEEQGLEVVHRMRFRDHHRYAPGDVRNILLAARHQQAEIVVTTEKDLVNLWHAADSAHSSSTNLEETVAELFQPLPVYWIRIAPVIENGEQLIAFIEDRIAPRRSLHPASALAKEPIS